MSIPTVLLVNPNFMRPPIAPLGLEYAASAIERAGYQPIVCDLAFAEDWRALLDAALNDIRPLAAGISIRNIDDAYFVSQDFVLEKTAAVVRHLMQSEAPVVLGGVGFSAMPSEVLAYTGAPYGISGEAEEAFPALLACLAQSGPLDKVPGLLYRNECGGTIENPRRPVDLSSMPTPARTYVDNPRYFREGGQIGLETKRGCDRTCIYCIDPLAKGNQVRHRVPKSIADEFGQLLDAGIDVFHLCDSEFNLPPQHARGVCEALIEQGLNERIHWYAYGSPSPFDHELAGLMARAGCAGINFGVDHCDPDMLQRLGRNYGPDDIRRAVEAAKGAGLATMVDTLLGSPGETRESIERCIRFMGDINPDRVGLACGVRVYPHTPLARSVLAQGPLRDNPNLHGALQENDNLLRPIFFIDQNVGKRLHEIVWSLAQGDPRFFATDPREMERNYNYNDNTVLNEAIRRGERGAYWDVLRRIAST